MFFARTQRGFAARLMSASHLQQENQVYSMLRSFLRESDCQQEAARCVRTHGVFRQREYPDVFQQAMPPRTIRS